MLAYRYSACPNAIEYLLEKYTQSKSENGYRGKVQLFVGMFDKCLVWYLQVLPSETHAFVNMTSLRVIDGDTSCHSPESFSLNKRRSMGKRSTISREPKRIIDHKRKKVLLSSRLG